MVLFNGLISISKHNKKKCVNMAIMRIVYMSTIYYNKTIPRR